MAMLLASAVLIGSVGAGTVPSNEPYMYTITGACDVQGSIDGLSFLKRGVTASGAPWFKAIDSETYLYWDPDCMGSGDGTARWIIDHDKPDIKAKSDLDNDHFCDYVGRIDSTDLSQPPTQGMWTMQCGGTLQQNYLILLAGTTTPKPNLVIGATTTDEPDEKEDEEEDEKEDEEATEKSSLMLVGACELKSFLNDLVFEEAGNTADGKPFFKAQDADQYLYFDSDCDGDDGAAPASGRWILDSSEPSTTATEDLDEDGKCDYHARYDGDSDRPPASATWRMYCGREDGWVDVDLTLQEEEESEEEEEEEETAGGKKKKKKAIMLSSSHRGSVQLLAAALVAVSTLRLAA